MDGEAYNESTKCLGGGNSSGMDEAGAHSRSVLVDEFGLDLGLHGVDCTLGKDSAGFGVVDCNTTDFGLDLGRKSGALYSQVLALSVAHRNSFTDLELPF